ncbi:MAG TPA: aminotransferase class V-fold PLP-dependent enzyme [bacterium]|nr:aminotransferase class V-fold PLP-dependent enzyme [bacterium]
MTATFKHLWALDTAKIHLNHGSFGACPTAILEHQRRLRDEMEASPTDFFVRRSPDMLTAARTELSRFLNADPEGMTFVPNATAGVNGVLRSRHWKKGDAILTTKLLYPACRNALAFIAEEFGVTVNMIDIPYPPKSADDIVERIVAAATPATRLALIDHVTSSTALVLPIARIVAELKKKGIPTLVDGAHGPGMTPLDLTKIGAAWYTGNCHKWLCTPIGSAFLWVAPEERERTYPLSISNYFYTPEGRAGFRAAFDWTGTADLTPFLCIGEGIRFMGSLLPGGWEELRNRNNTLVRQMAPVVAKALKTTAPELGDLNGSMVTIPIPWLPYTVEANNLHPLMNRLYARHGIEVMITCIPDGRSALRISAQIYNEPADYEALATALSQELPALRS